MFSASLSRFVRFPSLSFSPMVAVTAWAMRGFSWVNEIESAAPSLDGCVVICLRMRFRTPSASASCVSPKGFSVSMISIRAVRLNRSSVTCWLSCFSGSSNSLPSLDKPLT